MCVLLANTTKDDKQQRQQLQRQQTGENDHLAGYRVVAKRRVARVRVLESHAPPHVNGVFGGYHHRIRAREMHLLDNE